ncbi:ATP-dependent metallopeptidase FtsH/Yme1/Tma family protein, partial [Oleiphilus sp. HI0061]
MVKNLVLWLVIAAVLLTVFNNFNGQQKVKPMDYSQFIELVQGGQVKEVAIDGLHFDVVTTDGRHYETVRPMVEDPGLMHDLIENKVRVVGKEPEQ